MIPVRIGFDVRLNEHILGKLNGQFVLVSDTYSGYTYPKLHESEFFGVINDSICLLRFSGQDSWELDIKCHYERP